MLNASVTGLLTGLSLIVAIGAQNAFVLRQGLRRSRVGAIVTVCILSDIALTLAGVAGIGAVVQHAGWALQAVRWSTRGDGRDPARTVTALLGVLVATVALVRAAQEWALIALGAAALVATVGGGPRRGVG